MGPSSRFLAELINDVYGFPLEPLEEGALKSSKGLHDSLSGDREKTAKLKEKRQELKTKPGRGKADINTLSSKEWGQVKSPPSALESMEDDLGEKEVGKEAELVANISLVGGKGESDGDKTREKCGERSGTENNPIFHLKLQSFVDINVEVVQTTEGTVITEADERGATKEKDEAVESGRLFKPPESPARQELLKSKSGGDVEEFGVETEVVVQSSDERGFDRNDDGLKSLPNIVSRARMRSLPTCGEEDYRLKVSCQMEGEVEIEDADILLAPSSRRFRGQVKKIS